MGYFYGVGQAVADLQLIAEKGVANGYASLDSTGLVPFTQIFGSDVRLRRTAAATLTVDDGADGNVKVRWGSGENVGFYLAAGVNTPHLQDIRHGTAAAPITAVGPTFKVSRTDATLKASTEAVGGVGTDGAEQVAAIMGISTGTAACEVQTVGLYGAAKNKSTASGGGDDACGVYGIGRVTDSGTGVAIGGFFAGRRENDTGKMTGVEVHNANYGTVNADYSSSGFGGGAAVWANCSGNADSASAFTVSNAFGRQFENGLSFTAQVTSGKTGGVRVTSIRDDSSSVTTLDIRGSHTHGIDFYNGTFSGGLMRLKNNVAVRARNAADSADVDAFKFNAFNELETSLARISTSGSLSFGAGASIRPSTTGAGLRIGGATNELIGFWNVTAVVQPTAVADASGGGTIDTEARTALNALLARVRTIGLIAT